MRNFAAFVSLSSQATYSRVSVRKPDLAMDASGVFQKGP
jgi:hypothetical protein